MSGYKSNEFLKEFTSRTKANLDFINRVAVSHAKNISRDEKERILDEMLDARAYEITQRINSFFGFIILPFEKYNFKSKKKDGLLAVCSKDKYILGCVEQIKNIILNCSLSGRYYCDYNNMTKPIEEYDFEHTINFIRHLRNSIAHGGNEGIMFCPLAYNTETERDIGIQDIIFYDVNKHGKDGCNLPDEKFCIQINVNNELDELWETIVNLFVKIEEIDVSLKRGSSSVEKMEKKIKEWIKLMNQNL